MSDCSFAATKKRLGNLKSDDKCVSLQPKVRKSVKNKHKTELSGVYYEDRTRHYQPI